MTSRSAPQPAAASSLRTLLACVLILVAGVVALWSSTDGLRAFTTETARRLDVREHPRTVPDVELQGADGRRVSFGALRGRWVLVDFIYTGCLTYCTAQGAEFAQLQDRLAHPIENGEVALLSISFDPDRDGPGELAAYLRRSRDRGAGWIAARPANQADLAPLMRAFGVVAVPDGMGGYLHNASIAVVDPRGRLIAIADWNDLDEAERWVLRGSGR